MDRRNFLNLGAGALLTSLIIKSNTAFPHPKKVKDIGIQLYTLRDLLAKDLGGTLKKVSDIGYRNIELFGYGEGKYFGKSVTEMRKMTDDLGLNVVSAHYLSGQGSNAWGTPVNQWEKAVEDAAKMGQKYMAVAFLMPNERKVITDYNKVADILNKAGEISSKYGITMAYHNHDFEFIPLDGQIPMDVLLKNTAADLVKFELDIYWIKKAGLDPIQFFKQNKGRVPLWHVKDMEKDSGDFAPVGDGVIDWTTIFQEEKTAGLTHFFVEQDNHKNGTPLGNVEKSLKWLRSFDY
jgi:sugar phosphate isomerase/epimerase